MLACVEFILLLNPFSNYFFAQLHLHIAKKSSIFMYLKRQKLANTIILFVKHSSQKVYQNFLLALKVIDKICKFRENYRDNFRSIFALSRMGKDIIVSTLARALSGHSKESAQFIFTNSHKFRGCAAHVCTLFSSTANLRESYGSHVY